MVNGLKRTPMSFLALAGLVIVFVVAVLTAIDTTPPAAEPAGTDTTAFSAERAFEHIEHIAQEPHPMGSAEHERVRDYLVDELDSLGLEPELQDAVGITPRDPTGIVPTGRVQNIIATIEGSAPTGQIVLAAHYDSVPSGPGANDDAAGIAVILEAVRAMQQQTDQPVNDVVILFTDAEEQGLLGAEAFTNDHPLAADGGVVLNHEARGGGGTVNMFRLTEGSTDLISTFATAAPYPVADSAVADLFELLPNDTDFVAFAEGGFEAMDFAYAGDSAHYHSITDTPENVDLGTVQQMGANTLAMTTELGGTDLTNRDSGPPMVYFNLPPGLLIQIPAGVMLPLAVAAVGLGVAAVVLARRQHHTSVPRVLTGAVLTVVLLAAGVLAGLGYWNGLVVLKPAFSALLTGTPYEPGWFEVGMLLVATAVSLAWYGLFRRRVGVPGLALGAVNLLALGGVGAAAWSPAGAAALVLPAFGAAAGSVLTLIASPRSGWRPVALTVGIIPASVLLLGGAWIGLDMGVAMAAYLAVPLAVLGLVLLLPLADLWWREPRVVAMPVVCLLAAVLATGAGLAANPMDDGTQPVPADLNYIMDADTGEAYWASPIFPNTANPAQTTPGEWASQFTGAEVGPDPTPGQSRPDPQAHVSTAPAIEVDPPELQVLNDATEDGIRTIHLEATSVRGADHLGLYFEQGTEHIQQFTVQDRVMEPKPNETGRLGFQFWALPADHTISVEIVTEADGPLPVQLADFDVLPSAMDDLPGYEPPPENVYLLQNRLSVTRSIDL